MTATINPTVKPQKLFWIDMEMTGLDPQKEVVIEVACIITDFNFTVLDEAAFVIKQPQKYIDGMDEWNKKHHGESGLIAKIPNGLAPDIVEQKLCELVKKHFTDPKDKPVIAGNSIAQDRSFINQHFQKFAQLLHYRMLDVSSFKIIFQNKYNKKYEKKNAHRALDDIKESIEELKFYLTHIAI